MLPKQKYDVAISVAEEDLPVAEKIAGAFREHGIRYYLYTEVDEDWGNHLMEVVLSTFRSNSKYVLMITSRVFAEKYWAGVENLIAQAGNGKQLLQLRLDDTPVPGLNPYVIFKRWRDNPEEIAKTIRKKIKRTVPFRLAFVPTLMLTCLIAGILISSIYAWNSILPFQSTAAPGDTTRLEATFTRCQGITKKGEQCKNKAVKTGKFCHVHLK